MNFIQGNKLLTRTECSALRGLAIIGIFLHNYLHWLRPMVKENEYQFHQNNVDTLLSMLSSPSWDLPLQLFSFFGHYGVPVFLFLSGYGLVLKYEREGAIKADVGEFMKSHYLKLFPMMLLGFTAFAIVDWMTRGHHTWAWTDILAQLTMTINLLPQPDKIIWPGPYWFFGLMMQLYLIYILCIYRRGNGTVWTIIALTWAMQAACMMEPEGEMLNRLRYNFVGGAMPFGMGVLTARCKKVPMFTNGQWWGVLAANLVLCLLGSLNFHSWLWVPLVVVVANVALVKVVPSLMVRACCWVGMLSSAIFVCHPITRKVFIPISRSGQVMDGLVLYIVTTLVLAMLFKMIIDKKPFSNK